MASRNLKNVFFAAFLTGCISTSSMSQALCTPTTSTPISAKPAFSPLAQRVIFGLLALQLCYITGSTAVKKALEEQCHPKNLIKNVAWQYFITTIGTLTHELGHAIAANLLNNDKFNIHLGANSSDRNSSLFQIGESISIDGIDPVVGHSFYRSPKNTHGSLNTLTLSSIIAAGATSAIAGNVLLNSTLSSLFPNEQEFEHSWQTNPIIINQLWNLLIPAGNNDAAELYTECFGLSAEVVKNITPITTYLAFLPELYYLQTTAAHPGRYGAHSKAFLAFANWHLNGFVRFHL